MKSGIRWTELFYTHRFLSLTGRNPTSLPLVSAVVQAEKAEEPVLALHQYPTVKTFLPQERERKNCKSEQVWADGRQRVGFGDTVLQTECGVWNSETFSCPVDAPRSMKMFPLNKGKNRFVVWTWPGRDAVVRVRVGFTVADAPQRVPAIGFVHSFSGWCEATVCVTPGSCLSTYGTKALVRQKTWGTLRLDFQSHIPKAALRGPRVGIPSPGVAWQPTSG